MNINEIQMNPFKEIGSDWGLVSSGAKGDCNTMTISWGGVGVLWSKNVVFAFIRQTRYTNRRSLSAVQRAAETLTNGLPRDLRPPKKAELYIRRRQNALSFAENLPQCP